MGQSTIVGLCWEHISTVTVKDSLLVNKMVEIGDWRYDWWKCDQCVFSSPSRWHWEGLDQKCDGNFPPEDLRSLRSTPRTVGLPPDREQTWVGVQMAAVTAAVVLMLSVVTIFVFQVLVECRQRRRSTGDLSVSLWLSGSWHHSARAAARARLPPRAHQERPWPVRQDQLGKRPTRWEQRSSEALLWCQTINSIKSSPLRIFF